MQKIGGEWIISKNGFKYLFDWAETQNDEEEAIREIGYVFQEKFSAVSSDDKTLVICIR